MTMTNLVSANILKGVGALAAAGIIGGIVLTACSVTPEESSAGYSEELEPRLLGPSEPPRILSVEIVRPENTDKDLKEVLYPVLADTNHKISRDYGVLIEEQGIALRGTFLIDPDGKLQWLSINALGTGRSVEEVLRTLQALRTGGLCPAGWQPGSPTLNP